jgi:hypothetical protein
MELIFRILGIIGLLIVTAGIFVRDREKEDFVFIIGGAFLFSYSLSIKDPIFSLLQIAFIGSAIFNIIRLERKKKLKRKKKKK